MKELLKIARAAIESRLNGRRVDVDEAVRKKFSENAACFVTLSIDNELRGCIGSLEARQELWKDVIDNSINAGFNDYRFSPLAKDELKKIKIEISVLTKPEKLGIGKEVFNKIDKKMGIILVRGNYHSTFLPQVWKELVSKKSFLSHLSQKAGLGKDGWKESELYFYRVNSVKE